MYEIGQREIDAVAGVIRSGRLFRYRGGEGGWCDRFEAALARKVGVRHALAVNSGTSALICALAGAGVGPGDEVIVPAYTFMASALAALAVGAVPVIAEIDETLLLDPADAERKITRYTKAIMPVHMIGRICDMARIGRLARRRKLIVVEDACQAIGGSYRGKWAGSIGQVGAFSFNYYKNITCGEGGAVLTSDPVIHDRARIHHDGGCAFRKHADEISVPFFAGQDYRISEISGAIMHVQLRRLEGILRRLRARRRAMREVLAGAKAFALCPANEEVGDCGTSLPLMFESARDAQAFAAAHKDRIGVTRPIDTDRHVYANWEPVLNRRGSHAEGLNAYRLARRRVTYTKDCCPRSLDIMARTAYLSVPYRATLAEARALARRLRDH